MNKSQILKDTQISKQTQFTNKHQIFKDDQISKEPNLQTNPKF